MTVRKFTMNPEAVLSARSLNAIRGGESTSETLKEAIERLEKEKPKLEIPDPIVSPCDNA